MDPEPDPTPDPTPFFSDFKDAKKNIFLFIFFAYYLPAGTLSSALKAKRERNGPKKPKKYITNVS
jgi:hypothetical protein